MTVYFYPTTGGVKQTTLKIQSDGAETVSIPVKGTGIKSDGYITGGPTNLSFETQVGTKVTQTFNVKYSYPDGSIMINSVGGDGETTPNEDGAMLMLSNDKDEFSWTKPIFIQDSTLNDNCRRKDFTPSIIPFLVKSLDMKLTGDNCFDVSPSRILLQSVPCSKTVTVTYRPDCVGDHEAVLTIYLIGGKARPLTITLHGTATGQLYGATNNDTQSLMNTPSGAHGTTDLNELTMDSKVYAKGLNIIIESPVEQSAIISDISGHAQRVNLQAGHNEIPVNASGIYIVGIREKTTKLLLK